MCGLFCACTTIDPDVKHPDKNMRWEYDAEGESSSNGDVDWYCSRVFRGGWRHRYIGKTGPDGKPMEPRVAFKQDPRTGKRVKDEFLADVEKFKDSVVNWGASDL